MPTLRKYEQVFNKTDIGLGIGGNPTDSTTMTDRLLDSKDKNSVMNSNEITIDPPQPEQPKQLTYQDFMEIMRRD